jgi:twitching motility protein PilU
LHEAGKVTYEDALRNADSVNDLRLRFKLESKVSKGKDASSKLDHLGML